MKKSDFWESIILFLSAILLLPIWWLSSSTSIPIPEGVLNALQVVLLVVLGVILVRRFRRVQAGLRESKNRQKPFSF
ncbi:MAG: hypothetical protein ACE1ZS_02045 [Candidatus Poribacteria bacterium]|nr:hypothetical protein [Candidatus Poribacteria bacterium]